jgi:hypothetical protein
MTRTTMRARRQGVRLPPGDVRSRADIQRFRSGSLAFFGEGASGRLSSKVSRDARLSIRLAPDDGKSTGSGVASARAAALNPNGGVAAIAYGSA